MRKGANSLLDLRRFYLGEVEVVTCDPNKVVAALIQVANDRFRRERTVER
jgi:hypothetical protein